MRIYKYIIVKLIDYTDTINYYIQSFGFIIYILRQKNVDG